MLFRSRGANGFDIVTPAQRKREAKKVKAQKMLKTAEFKQRARNMGIAEEGLVAQKVAIWEGMCAAEQSGHSVEVRITYSASFWKLLWDCC